MLFSTVTSLVYIPINCVHRLVFCCCFELLSFNRMNSELGEFFQERYETYA